MITTIDRYKWLRIDGESYKVRVDNFFGLPTYIDPTLSPGTVELRDAFGNTLSRFSSCLSGDGRAEHE